MVADTYSPRLGMLEMGTGNQNNSWGDSFNTSFAIIIDRAVAGIINRADTGGTLDLSGTPPPAAARQDIEAIQNFTGVLVSNLTVIVPNLSKTWLIANNTTNAFNLYIKTTAGTATQIPVGTTKLVYCDGANGVKRTDAEEIGSFRLSGKSAAGAGELACSGASLLRTDYPDLFAKIGTVWGAVDGTHFTLPLLTDTNRYLRAGGGAGPAVGTYQTNQNLAHTHTVTGAPSAGTLATVSDGAHVHTITDPGHVHAYSVHTTNGTLGTGTTFTYVDTAPGAVVPNTISSTTGISINSGGAHTHAITGAPGIGTLATASSGGTEARPESAAVLICIKY